MILSAIGMVALLGFFAAGPNKGGWTPEQWSLIIPILGLQVIGVVTAWRKGDRNADKIDAVHHEIRPPSNGTTSGALQEFVAGWIPWLYEELRLIGKTLNVDQHGPPPELPKVQPPIRPSERRRDKHP